jgi:hypothetical protein
MADLTSLGISTVNEVLKSCRGTCGSSERMGCSQSIENDRNIARANLEFNDSQIEAKKAVEFTLGEKGSVSRVELSVSCRKLNHKERIMDGDPFFVAYERKSSREPFIEIARSEIISKTHNPKWINKITLNYNFEQPQLMKIEVYYCTTSFTSSNTSGLDLKEHQLLGHCLFSLGDIFGSTHRGWFGPLRSPGITISSSSFSRDDDLTQGVGVGAKRGGYMTIQGEELASISDKISLRLECRKLKNMELFSKSDPFLVISKQRDDGSWATCYKSEVMSNNLSPAYEIRSSTLELANGDMERILKIEIFDWNISGHHTYIGTVHPPSSLLLLHSLSLLARSLSVSVCLYLSVSVCLSVCPSVGETMCSLKSLQEEVESQRNGSPETPLILMNGKADPTAKKNSEASSNRGTILVRTCTVTHTSSFLDYIRAGAQVRLSLFISVPLTPSLSCNSWWLWITLSPIVHLSRGLHSILSIKTIATFSTSTPTRSSLSVTSWRHIAVARTRCAALSMVLEDSCQLMDQ